MADVWGESGHRVVVADCVLEHPTLHRNAGLENGEGVADAALFGASVSRIAQPVPGRSFFFVSAGSPAGDPDRVVTSARWGRLQDGFRDAGVTFVVFLREGCVGEAMLIEGADDVVVLTDSSERVPRSAREAAGKVRVLVGVDVADQGGTAVEPDTGPEDASAALDLDNSWETPADAGSVDSSDTGWDDPGLAGLGNWGSTGSVDEEGHQDQDDHEPEAAVDFTLAPEDEGETVADDLAAPVQGADAELSPPEEPEAEQGAPNVHAPEAEAAEPASTMPPSNRRGRRGGADPDARRKLLWVGLAVLILIVLVVLGALR